MSAVLFGGLMITARVNPGQPDRVARDEMDVNGQRVPRFSVTVTPPDPKNQLGAPLAEDEVMFTTLKTPTGDPDAFEWEDAPLGRNPLVGRLSRMLEKATRDYNRDYGTGTRNDFLFPNLQLSDAGRDLLRKALEEILEQAPKSALIDDVKAQAADLLDRAMQFRAQVGLTPDGVGYQWDVAEVDSCRIKR